MTNPDDRAYCSSVFGALLHRVDKARALVLMDRHNGAVLRAWREGADPAAMAAAIATADAA